MKLSGSTKIQDLLIAYPFLEDFLAAQSPKFEMLKNRMARATVGCVATLRTAAGIANLDLNALLHSLAAEIERRGNDDFWHGRERGRRARDRAAPVAPPSTWRSGHARLMQAKSRHAGAVMAAGIERRRSSNVLQRQYHPPISMEPSTAKLNIGPHATSQ